MIYLYPAAFPGTNFAQHFDTCPFPENSNGNANSGITVNVKLLIEVSLLLLDRQLGVLVLSKITRSRGNWTVDIWRGIHAARLCCNPPMRRRVTHCTSSVRPSVLSELLTLELISTESSDLVCISSMATVTRITIFKSNVGTSRPKKLRRQMKWLGPD